MPCNSREYIGCRKLSYGCSSSNNEYRPCENIEDVMELLEIEERNDENDEKIRKYLFDNCCNKQSHSILYYLKQFIIKNFKKKVI